MNDELRPPLAEPVQGEPAPPSEPPAAPPAEPIALLVERSPWRLRDLAAFLLFLFPAFVFATLGTSAAYGVLRHVFGWKPVADLSHNAFFLVPMQTLFYAFVFSYLYGLAVLRYRTSFWRAIAWVPIEAEKRFGYLIAGGMLALGVQLASALVPPKSKLPLDQLFSSPAAAYLLAVFGIAVAPFVEETVFRGFIYAVLEKVGGAVVAIVGSGLLFGAIHVPQLWGGWMQIGLLFAVGVTFGLVRWRSGSLLPSLLMHVAYNFTIFVYFYLGTDGFRRMT